MPLNEYYWLDESNWSENDKLIFISIKLKSNLQLTPEEKIVWESRPHTKPFKTNRKVLLELDRYEKEKDEFLQEFLKKHFSSG